MVTRTPGHVTMIHTGSTGVRGYSFIEGEKCGLMHNWLLMS